MSYIIKLVLYLYCYIVRLYYKFLRKFASSSPEFLACSRSFLTIGASIHYYQARVLSSTIYIYPILGQPPAPL